MYSSASDGKREDQSNGKSSQIPSSSSTQSRTQSTPAKPPAVRSQISVASISVASISVASPQRPGAVVFDHSDNLAYQQSAARKDAYVAQFAETEIRNEAQRKMKLAREKKAEAKRLQDAEAARRERNRVAQLAAARHRSENVAELRLTQTKVAQMKSKAKGKQKQIDIDDDDGDDLTCGISRYRSVFIGLTLWYWSDESKQISG